MQELSEYEAAIVARFEAAEVPAEVVDAREATDRMICDSGAVGAEWHLTAGDSR